MAVGCRHPVASLREVSHSSKRSADEEAPAAAVAVVPVEEVAALVEAAVAVDSLLRLWEAA